MAKTLIDIRGNIYDVWEFRSLEKGEEYDEVSGEMKHYIIMNRDAIQTNYQAVKFPFESEEDRDEYMKQLKYRLAEFDTVQFV